MKDKDYIPGIGTPDSSKYDAPGAVYPPKETLKQKRDRFARFYGPAPHHPPER